MQALPREIRARVLFTGLTMHTCEVDPRHTPSLSLKSTQNSGRCQSLWKISRHKKILKRCSSRCQQQRTKISRHGNRRIKLFLHEPERWFIEMFSFKNGILICSSVFVPRFYCRLRMVADDFPVKLNPVQECFFYFRLWKAHVFKSYKKGWKWTYYEVKTLSSLFLYFKRIMVDCYRAINQGIKFGNIWEICVCPQTLETLEMRLFAKRALLTATKRGDIGEIFSRVHPSWGQVTKDFVSERLGSNLSVWLCNEWQCLFVCNESFGVFLVAFFCWKHKLQFSLYLLSGMKNVSMREKCRFKHCLSVKERSF